MVKIEFEEDDKGVPENINDLDFEEEVKELTKTKKKPGKEIPKEISKEIPKEVEEETKEEELTPEQNLQNFVQQVIGKLEELEGRIIQIEATIFRLKSI